MIHPNDVPLADVTALVWGCVLVTCETISAIELVRAKLHYRKCIICEKPVSKREQAKDTETALHCQCQARARLIAREWLVRGSATQGLIPDYELTRNANQPLTLRFNLRDLIDAIAHVSAVDHRPHRPTGDKLRASHKR
jgi:hypothetical protein